MTGPYRWARESTPEVGYEVSTKGDSRFSALNAVMPDGRTLEMWYQCDIKRYDIGGTNWREGKGKPPAPGAYSITRELQWELYLNLWRIWAIRNESLMFELASAVKGKGWVLTDRFATSSINQARALSVILNDWFPVMPRAINMFELGNEP